MQSDIFHLSCLWLITNPTRYSETFLNKNFVEKPAATFCRNLMELRGNGTNLQRSRWISLCGSSLLLWKTTSCINRGEFSDVFEQGVHEKVAKISQDGMCWAQVRCGFFLWFGQFPAWWVVERHPKMGVLSTVGLVGCGLTRRCQVEFKKKRNELFWNPGTQSEKFGLVGHYLTTLFCFVRKQKGFQINLGCIAAVCCSFLWVLHIWHSAWDCRFIHLPGTSWFYVRNSELDWHPIVWKLAWWYRFFSEENYLHLNQWKLHTT